jgi:hypothetical protein
MDVVGCVLDGQKTIMTLWYQCSVRRKPTVQINVVAGAFIVLMSGLFFSSCVTDEETEAESDGSSYVLSERTCAAGQACVGGRIDYRGNRTGRVYVLLKKADYIDEKVADTMLGVSLPEPGEFLIRGVPPGRYLLEAFIDLNATGQRNDPSPIRTSAEFGVTGEGVFEVDLELRDPPPRDLLEPSWIEVLPINNGAVIDWEGDESLFEAALFYNIYWSTEPDVGPGQIAGGGQRLKLPARQSENFWVNTDLENGREYYVTVQLEVDGRVGPPGTPVGPTLIGRPKSENTVRGVVHFDGYSVDGPLIISMIDNYEDRQVWEVVENPTNPQPFEISGMEDGTWEIVLALDRDGDGQIWKNDPSFCYFDGEFMPFIELSGGVVDLGELQLDTPNSYRAVRSVHWTDGVQDEYRVELHVRQGLQLPINVMLLEAPGLAGSADLHGYEVHFVHGKVWEVTINYGSTRPPETGQYVFAIEYEDGTWEELYYPAPTILDSFPIPVAPVGPSPGTLQPTFRWTHPEIIPQGEFLRPSSQFPFDGTHLYRVRVLGPKSLFGGLTRPPGGGAVLQGGRQVPNWWISPRLTDDVNEAVYNFAGYPRQRWRSQGAEPDGRQLSPGTAYVWQIEMRDMLGNQAIYETEFTP